jgi:type 1 glutamine amidotransferase/mono/diheme cytochrome c family protein/glucose/arabinose dehydrogenase
MVHADTVAPNQPTPGNTFPVLTPQEEAKTFQLPPGYHMELVLSDPDIKEPVACVFDGNGRMYVAEMRTYMQDIDATGEMNPVNRVSLHESTKGDGVYDKHTVFADGLLPPREILPLADRVLINETNTSDIYSYPMSGASGSKEIFYKGGPRGGNIEHQPSGLIWGLDNWIYQAVSDLRLRYTGGVVTEGHTPGNGGQWGLGEDDYGKMWFVNAGGEFGPLHYQTPIIYGAYELPEDRSPDFQEVWPLVGLADVQGGPGRFRPTDKTLNHTTSAAGIAVYRGDRLPADLRGDVLFPEPVGRLIRRAKVEDKEGLTVLHNAYDKSEFIRSTDPNFRPVNITNGPDGCLYIVDMYRGIIQQATWVNPGSYLRSVVQKYGMQNITSHGRIWRLMHDGQTPGPQPHMLDESATQLVAHLDHPNGWWRDQAQMLLVLKNDKSVVPALEQIARTNANPLARIHAIWTLEGLSALNASLVREKLKDTEPQVRIAAMRAGESLVRAGDTSLVGDLKAMSKDKSPDVVLQTLLTGKVLNWPDYRANAQSIIASSTAEGVQKIGSLILTEGYGIDQHRFNQADLDRLRKGQAIYESLCFACHGFDGAGMPLNGAPAGTTQAPPLARAREVRGHRDLIVKILLNGLSGPVHGKTYAAQMVPMDSNADQWIADVASFVRNAFGNRASMISAADVASMRPAARARAKPWTIDELRNLDPQPVGNPRDWKVTASLNPGDAQQMIDGDPHTRWTSNTELAPGMWVQIELPQKSPIGGLSIDCVQSPNDYAREYKVELSDDGITWGQPVAQGRGTPGVMEIHFPAATAKFLRLTQTGTLAPDHGLFWSIHELEVLQPSVGKQSSQASTDALPSSSALPPLPQAQPEDLEKMDAALPRGAYAKPPHARKILIYGNANGFVHSSIPLGEQAIAALGASTGAWTATISNDPAVFDDLKDFDAIVLVSTTGRFLLPHADLPNDATPDQRKASDQRAIHYEQAESQRMQNLLRFVRKSGKGLVGIHAATDAYKEVRAYGDLIGGYFNGHPWNEKVGIKLDDPASPLTQMFDKSGFDVADEIYQFTPMLNDQKQDQQPYSRSLDHVLLSLDYTTPDRTARKGSSPDNDFAVAWIHQAGKGRVFYCSLGHREEIYANPTVLKFYLAGIQYALGDLSANPVSAARTAAK